MQNLAPALFEVPHEGQRSANGAAHRSQNFAPSGFSEPHLKQRIESPEDQTTGPSCITQRKEGAASLTSRFSATRQMLGEVQGDRTPSRDAQIRAIRLLFQNVDRSEID